MQVYKDQRLDSHHIFRYIFCGTYSMETARAVKSQLHQEPNVDSEGKTGIDHATGRLRGAA